MKGADEGSFWRMWLSVTMKSSTKISVCEIENFASLRAPFAVKNTPFEARKSPESVSPSMLFHVGVADGVR